MNVWSLVVLSSWLRRNKINFEENYINIYRLVSTWFFSRGGPIRSIYNSASLLKDEYDLTIITSNRDLNSKIPYKGTEKIYFI